MRAASSNAETASHAACICDAGVRPTAAALKGRRYDLSIVVAATAQSSAVA
jgi:hypothetical protein